MTTIKRRTTGDPKTIYPELCTAASYEPPFTVKVPNWPSACPICGAEDSGIIVNFASFVHGPVYACGGQYRLKPQIQKHTYVWWGTCGTASREVWQLSELGTGQLCSPPFGFSTSVIAVNKATGKRSKYAVATGYNSKSQKSEYEARKIIQRHTALFGG